MPSGKCTSHPGFGLGWSAKKEGTKTKVGDFPDASSHHIHNAVYLTDTTKRSHRVSNLEYDRWHRFEVTIQKGSEAPQQGSVAIVKTGKNPNEKPRVTRLQAVECDNSHNQICLEWEVSDENVTKDFLIHIGSAKQSDYNKFDHIVAPVPGDSQVNVRSFDKIAGPKARSHTVTGLTPNRKHWIQVGTSDDLLNGAPVIIVETHGDPQKAPKPDCVAQIYKDEGKTAPYLAAYCKSPGQLQDNRVLRGHQITVKAYDGWEIYQQSFYDGMLGHTVPMPHARQGEQYLVEVEAIYTSLWEKDEYSQPDIQRVGYGDDSIASCQSCHPDGKGINLVKEAKWHASNGLAKAKKANDSAATAMWLEVQAALRGDSAQFSIAEAAEKMKEAKSENERVVWSVIHYALRVIDGQVNISGFN